MVALIALLPTLVALGLVVFGLGGYQPTLPRVLWLIVAAIIVGPLAVALFGVLGWLAMVIAGTLAMTAYAATRRPVGG